MRMNHQRPLLVIMIFPTVFFILGQISPIQIQISSTLGLSKTWVYILPQDHVPCFSILKSVLHDIRYSKSSIFFQDSLYSNEII